MSKQKMILIGSGNRIEYGLRCLLLCTDNFLSLSRMSKITNPQICFTFSSTVGLSPRTDLADNKFSFWRDFFFLDYSESPPFENIPYLLASRFHHFRFKCSLVFFRQKFRHQYVISERLCAVCSHGFLELREDEVDNEEGEIYGLNFLMVEGRGL